MASKSPTNPPNPHQRSPHSEMKQGILSPGFRSVAAMAGWDEEALLASLVVEDTPERESRHKKRPNLQQLKSPSTTHSNRKRRSKRQSHGSIPAVVLCLDDDGDEGTAKKDLGEKKDEVGNVIVDGEKNKKVEREGDLAEKASSKGLPCIDRLREELSCAICLEICFEPSTTPCGHSFCKKCLKCAATKCGKRCPKCRQLISNGRSCTVNTVLWNTIQLLFPDEVEARKKAAVENSRVNEAPTQSPNTGFVEVGSRNTISNNRSSSFRTATQVSLEMERRRSITRRRATPSQSEDVALAIRLQREEFMGAFDDNAVQPRHSVDFARANLRAMASRAFHIRTRGQYS